MTQQPKEQQKERKRNTLQQDPNKVDKAGRTKIFSCTSSGNLEKVQELIERGANINHLDNAGWSPIHEAALKGQFKVLQYLIEKGGMINVRGYENNDTPLHDACSFGYFDCVKLLIENGADVYALNLDKKRPIDLCEDKQCIKLLKSKMKEIDKLSHVDNTGKTALHRSCINGSLEQVEQLLNGIGANINSIENIQYYTPLHYSIENGFLEITKLLIEKGADLYFTTKNGSTILHLACKNNHEHIVKYLLELACTRKIIHIQDKNGSTPYQVTNSIKIRQLITQYIDQEKRLRATTEAIDEVTFVSNNTKQTAQKKSSARLSREERKIQAIMKAFEKAEKKQQARKSVVDSDTTNTKKRKAPSSSTNNSNAPSRQPSNSRECSVESTTPKKNTTIDPSKLDPFKKDTSGRTHLFKWSIKGNKQVVESLLKSGANPSEKDHAGYTALHEAALRGKTEIVRLLLENNADVNCKGNIEKDTPLHDATENGYPDCVEILLEFGADVTAKNQKGQTALDIAIEEENKEIEELLRRHKDIKPTKKRKLVLAADLETCNKQAQRQQQLESPTSPISLHNGFDMTTAKAHARQLSGQHLPKKSLKIIKTEAATTNVPPDGPHTPIPTPPPERWQHQQQKIKIKKEEEEEEEEEKELVDSETYPNIHCASRYLPLYTIQLLDQFFVVDLQISLLLGVDLLDRYPHLHKRQVKREEKERLWSPLSSMICSSMTTKELEKQKFLATDIYFVRLDQVVNMIKQDYSHLSESLITITLDIGYSSSSSSSSSSSTSSLSPPLVASLLPTQQQENLQQDKNTTTNTTVKLPPKFAMKMRKCGMLKFDQK